jgi:Holliday junction resolvase RusA-like endonuclease
MKHCVVLSGEPKSTQHIYRATCRGRFPTTYMTPAGKALKEQYQGEARHQWGFKKPLDCDIAVSITLYFGTKRKADLDNFNKLSLDALTGIVWQDDSQISKLSIERAYDKAQPRLEIAVEAR